MDKFDVLKHYFGHTTFRPGQEEMIDAILAGRDALGIMPTGGGKSLCYQVPALLQSGVTLVISPLISLMKDQVMALESAGVPAACLNSSLSAEERQEVLRGMRAGAYKLVYVAPERLGGDGFVALAQTLPLALVAVDEAHCISQWGQDFRPSYRRIVDFLDQLPVRPVLAAFTATATQQVRDDIERSLQLRDPVRVVTGFDRPNLYFEVQRPKSKLAAVRALVAARPGKSGIIYCATRSTTERVCDALRADGAAATRYHAGLPDDERRQNQEDFLYDRCPVMVATNAFGMGIDKSNVGYVIHCNMPKSLEAYYQEAGRAGRDGEKADCILLYSPADIQTAKFFLQNTAVSEELTEAEQRAVRIQDQQRLNAMAAYCKTTTCLRGAILGYFGQQHAPRCENCGNCRTQFTMRDYTREAQMILSCVKRVRDRLGYAVGAALLTDILCGSEEKRLLQLGLNDLSTYGLLKQTPKVQVRGWMEELEAHGYLRTDPQHGGVELTGAAAGVLFHGETVEMAVRELPAPARRRGKKGAAAPAEAAGGLFEALKALRAQLAQSEGVPAYIVFSNAALADMAARSPHSMAEFLEVSGVGEAKAKRYGKTFLAAIAAWENDGGAAGADAEQ